MQICLSSHYLMIRLSLVFKNSISHDWLFDHSVTSSSSLALVTVSMLGGRNYFWSTDSPRGKRSWSRTGNKAAFGSFTFLFAISSIFVCFGVFVCFCSFICLLTCYKAFTFTVFPDLWWCGHMDVFPLFCVRLAENEWVSKLKSLVLWINKHGEGMNFISFGNLKV